MGTLGSGLCRFFVNWTQARIFWKEGTGIENMPCVAWHKHAPIYIFILMGQELRALAAFVE